MYSKRRYRSNSPYSMYSPYKMNHRPTYRQRKGQILQRSISLRQGPSSSFTRDDLIKEGQRLVSEGIIPYPLTFDHMNIMNIPIKQFFIHSSIYDNTWLFYPSDLTKHLLDLIDVPTVTGYDLEVALGCIEFNISDEQSDNFTITLYSNRITTSSLALVNKAGGQVTSGDQNLSVLFSPYNDSNVSTRVYTANQSSFTASSRNLTVPSDQQPVDSGSCGFYPIFINTSDRIYNYIKYEGDIEDTKIKVNLCVIYYMIKI